MSRASAAVRAAAPRAPQTAVEALDAAGLSDHRLAHLVGQCAHESVDLTRVVESLYYTTPERIRAVWPSRFRSVAAARPYAREPEKLANKVYGGRMGNTETGDGWRFRGRGLLQLTGRSNYRAFGRRIGLPLEDEPEQAEDYAVGWRIAIAYLDSRRRFGRTAFEWADENNTEMVTRVVNGGLHGLADRRRRTVAALRAIGAVGQPLLRLGAVGPAVTVLQEALVRAGFPLGAVDGHFGPKTEAAVRAFQQARGLGVDGIAGRRTFGALGL